MTYDASDAPTTGKPDLRPPLPPADGRDPEVIRELLTLAALFLTPEPGAAFTRDALAAEARATCGPEITLRDEDIDAVLPHLEFLRVGDDGLWRMT